jgi:hypothetical protein
MEYKKREYFLSKPRLSRYFTACNNSLLESHHLYSANIEIAKEFYPLLNMFEIIFRNACNHQIALNFANNKWIMVEKNGFMSDDSLENSNYFLKKSVDSAEQNIRKNRKTVTPDQIVGELHFGFWTSFFNKYHFKLIKGCVLHIFPNKPDPMNRKAIEGKLSRVREFRNRVYHNEPICFNENSVDFTQADNIRRDIYELLLWMDTDLPDYVGSFDCSSKYILNKYNSRYGR